MAHLSLLGILLLSSCTVDYALHSQAVDHAQTAHVKIGEPQFNNYPNGLCDNDEDCGKNNELTNKCLDKNNGPKSGMCALSCNPLRCSKYACPDCPTSQNACELLIGTDDFICISGGDAPAYSACDQEKTFCTPGHFCYLNQCLPYCDAWLQPTTCVNNTRCIHFTADSKIGFCENK